MLESACDPQARHVARRPPSDRNTAEADLALAAINAADAIEHAGLAGTIGPYEREQLALAYRERDIVEHVETTEAQRQPLELELSHTSSGGGGIV